MSTMTMRSGSTVFYRLAAVGAWSLSLYTTYLFVNQVSAGAHWAFLLALIVQAALTGLESPIWRNKGGAANYVALVVDIFLNVGGASPLMARFDATSSYGAVASTFGLGALGPGAELVVTAGVGLLLAAAPEALWNAGR